ncbi:MAG: lysophospholipid acyltransferase family protein [candidate division WOR-3 bacterium]
MKASLPYKIGRPLFYWFFKIILGLKVEGLNNVPRKGGLIIAPNHRSNYDPPIIGSVINFRPVYFLAKKGLFINKTVSAVLKSVNAIPVDTEKPGVEVMKKFINLLKNGEAVIVFPEGRRSLTNEFLPPEPGVGYLSIKTGAPIVPTLIIGTHESMLNHFLRKSPLFVKFGKPIYPDKEKPTIKNSKTLSEKTMEEIKSLM